MATITPTRNEALPNHHLAKWEGLSSTDTEGAPVHLLGNGDRTVQCIGTFDSGTVTIQGSIDGDTWAALQDLEGNALTFTTAGVKGVLEAPPFIKPVLSGAGTDDVDVLLSVGKAS